ncbi:hypothetical protein K493DRAFT_320684 [Basidiobolus meristosporus CBS 931.73]|uniref:Uncharacterized protein n=1 Tax=Basidiobolus meristosporus CBS 931.73 TaxID=1314790 RepID=A0A1Y1X6G9_9FUNG|nr:hypothetical protein K493DRAFT_320684 [Basidiobolus meristosporus CBS 931.73]|eukprot:ORX81393.1 hypothetical protein K493DRAFT_320684 [Basidiobolus meristosporus CBS 931.73]
MGGTLGALANVVTTAGTTMAFARLTIAVAPATTLILLDLVAFSAGLLSPSS